MVNVCCVWRLSLASCASSCPAAWVGVICGANLLRVLFASTVTVAEQIRPPLSSTQTVEASMRVEALSMLTMLFVRMGRW